MTAIDPAERDLGLTTDSRSTLTGPALVTGGSRGIGRACALWRAAAPTSR